VADGDATEFSQKYTEEYVRESQAHISLSLKMINWQYVRHAMEEWHRPGSPTYPVEHPYKFKMSWLGKAIGLDGRGTELAELTSLAEECGAVRLGRVRVAGSKGKVSGVHGVDDAEAFIDALRTKL
jgi:hypothetical protein